jgi:hypothetical protein
VWNSINVGTPESIAATTDAAMERMENTRVPTNLSIAIIGIFKKKEVNF